MNQKAFQRECSCPMPTVEVRNLPKPPAADQMNYRSGRWVLAGLIAITCCSEPSSNSFEADHPSPMAIVRDTFSAVPLSLADRPELVPTSTFRTDSVYTLVNSESNPSTVEPSAVVQSGDGGWLLLEERNAALSWYNSAGELRRTFDREELRAFGLLYPRSLAVDSEGGLYIVDGAGLIGGISLDTNRLGIDTLIIFPGEAVAACFGDSHLFIHGFSNHNPMILHRYTRQGEPSGQFGEVYRSGNWMLDQFYSRGSITCAGPAEAVAFLPHHLGEIRVFSFRGDPLHEITLQGFRSVLAQNLHSQGIRVGARDSAGSHFNRPLLLANRGAAVFVQILLRRPEPQPDDTLTVVQSFTINLGQGGSVQILGGSTDSVLYMDSLALINKNGASASLIVHRNEEW